MLQSAGRPTRLTTPPNSACSASHHSVHLTACVSLCLPLSRRDRQLTRRCRISKKKCHETRCSSRRANDDEFLTKRSKRTCPMSLRKNDSLAWPALRQTGGQAGRQPIDRSTERVSYRRMDGRTDRAVRQPDEQTVKFRRRSIKNSMNFAQAIPTSNGSHSHRERTAKKQTMSTTTTTICKTDDFVCWACSG